MPLQARTKRPNPKASKSKSFLLNTPLRLVLVLTFHLILPHLGKAQQYLDKLLFEAPCECIPIHKPVKVYVGTGTMERKAITLKAGHPVRLGRIPGKRISIYFNPAITDLKTCSETRTLPMSQQVDTDALPPFHRLSKDFIPGFGKEGEKFLLEATRLSADEASLRFSDAQWLKDWARESGESINYSLTTLKRFNDAYALPSFEIWFTGNAEFPFLLFNNGQTGDMNANQPEIVLFGGTAIQRIHLNEGNRITPTLIKGDSTGLIIEEAYHCAIKVQNKWEFQNGQFQRIHGTFNTPVWPPKAIREDESMWTADWTIYSKWVTSPKPDRFSNPPVLQKNGRITHFQLLEVDHLHQKVKVNVKTDLQPNFPENQWVRPKDLQPCLQLIYIGACGAG